MSALERILLVEDDPHDAELTQLALAEGELDTPVDVARDGAEGLDYLFCRGAFAARPNDPPSFVLLDLKMPRVDGFEVLRQLRADPRLRVLPVVVLSSSRVSSDLERCYQLGANAFVVKPLTYQDFATAVKELGRFWAVHNQPPWGSP